MQSCVYAVYAVAMLVMMAALVALGLFVTNPVLIAAGAFAIVLSAMAVAYKLEQRIYNNLGD